MQEPNYLTNPTTTGADAQHLANVAKQVYGRWRNVLLTERCVTRTPRHLRWLNSRDDKTDKFAPPQVRGFYDRPGTLCELKNIITFPLDVIAKIHKALREFDQWLDKAEAGLQRHNAELIKHQQAEITRMRSEAAFSKAN